MKLELACLGPLEAQTAERVLLCNQASARFGLTLSREQAVALAAARKDALAQTGRVEFQGGVLEDLIFAFCDSPYISQDEYAQTLGELTRIFYAFKNETLDQPPDAELIAAMKSSFDGPCHGSLELLEGTFLAELARRERFRGLPQDEETPEDQDEGEEYDV